MWLDSLTDDEFRIIGREIISIFNTASRKRLPEIWIIYTETTCPDCGSMSDLPGLTMAQLGTLENDVNIRLDGLEKRLERLEQLVQHSEYIKSVGE